MKFERKNRSLAEVSYLTDAELMMIAPGSVFVFDVESYINFWYVAFKHVASGKIVDFEDSPGSRVNTRKLSWMMHRFCTVGFNSRTYDVPQVLLAIRGMSCGQLKEVTTAIIEGNNGDGMRAWEVEEAYSLRDDVQLLNHIDLIEVAPLKASLKIYGGRLHTKRMQDLPYPPDHTMSEEDAIYTRNYCSCSDLDNTILMMLELKDQIALREKMSAEYNLDLRSKSDAQIAETVISSEVAKILGGRVKKAGVRAGHKFKFQNPGYIKFQTPYMQGKLAEILDMDFEIDATGKVVLEGLKAFDLAINTTVYRMGKGGLHSKEKCVSYRATKTRRIVDRDVESYYPRLILNSGLFPLSTGPAFLEVFGVLVDRRLLAKRSGDKSTADSLKIVINGTFGKLGSKYSIMYAPELLIQVTLGGQLSLLMLIEALELRGIQVVSANTDGIVSLVDDHMREIFEQTVAEWELATSLKTEETEYAALYSRDINNYIAIKKDGSVKLKGAYSNPWSDPKNAIFRFHKNPVTTICIEAVVEMLTKRTSLQETITKCTDIRKFVTVRNVKGGAHKDGVYIGKACRWYYGKNQPGDLNYVLSGNKVPNSDGAVPLQDLPLELPDDIDYKRYIADATKMLFDLGYYTKAKTEALVF